MAQNNSGAVSERGETDAEERRAGKSVAPLFAAKALLRPDQSPAELPVILTAERAQAEAVERRRGEWIAASVLAPRQPSEID